MSLENEAVKKWLPKMHNFDAMEFTMLKFQVSVFVLVLTGLSFTFQVHASDCQEINLSGTFLFSSESENCKIDLGKSGSPSSVTLSFPLGVAPGTEQILLNPGEIKIEQAGGTEITVRGDGGLTTGTRRLEADVSPLKGVSEKLKCRRSSGTLLIEQRVKGRDLFGSHTEVNTWVFKTTPDGLRLTRSYYLKWAFAHLAEAEKECLFPRVSP